MVITVAVGAVLFLAGTGPAGAEGFEPAPPATREKATLKIAPLLLGNPAARLLTRQPAIPLDLDTENGHKAAFRYSHPLTAKNGDTLTGLLVGAGVGRRDAVDAIDAMREVFDPRRIKPGHELTVQFERHTEDDGPGRFLGFTMLPDFTREVAVARHPDGGFEVQETERQLTRAPARASGRIGSSLFVDGEKAGVPVPVLVELIRAYSWDVDFQRDIQPGDAFEVMFEQYTDSTGRIVHYGEVIYAALTLTGTELPIYRFTTRHGITAYFNDKGHGA
ncbi:MAG: M23 family peptidase, partial [Rhodospirillales bacterium]|nr:M23 family peptidase [Rhodospirillales bacterium]